jgi:hypothetical protein
MSNPNLYEIQGHTLARPYAPPAPALVLEAIAPVTLYADFTAIMNVAATLGSSSFTVNADVWLQSVNLLVSSDAVANGVSICIVIQANNLVTYIPSTAQPTSPRTVGAIMNFTLNPPYGQFLPRGSIITLYAVAVATSPTQSTAQIMVTGVYANTVQ